MHVGLSGFLKHVGCFIRPVRLYVSQNDFICGSSIPTLKSPKINIYILRNVSQRNYLMLPDGSYHRFMRIIGTILSNIFHSKGLSQQRISIGSLPVARRFEGISSLMYNMIPPPFESRSSLYGGLKP